MPEEKKKESFTFSDKIKNSKQPAAKSFANRISSKIGNDGRPRQTLFERTKRDAPFFIAALVALLLLPFLYKYSGSVNDDEGIVTPGYEDAIVNPDRSGFDFTGSDEGQISQLAGRDSMDLIVGFGKHRASEEEEDNFQDLYRSGLSEDNTSKKASYARNDMNEEINNTNIYRYRKQAAPQTRKAFRRAATKLGTLKGAGLTGRGGGRLGVGNFGGSLKNAAQKVRGETPRTSPKPVSLQPLTAAGKPSRSYFGQGAAAEARRSKDAMSKANPLQALMDAQMRAVEPGKIGGITGGDFGGPGGGNGKLERNFAFNGKEPWWWDMMKTRSQKRWEKWFNYKWGWIDWGTKLFQNFLDPFLSCFFTGTDDWSMGKMFGTVEGSGNPAKCGDLKEEDWNECSACLEHGKFGKSACKSYLATLTADSSMVKKGWQGSSQAGSSMTWWQSRRDCWTNGVVGKKSLNEVYDCNMLVNKYYQVAPTGAARNWHTYIYIVARNYLPATSKAKLDENTPRGYLCTDEDFLAIGKRASSGVQANGLNQKFDGSNSGDEQYRKTASRRLNRERGLTEDMYTRNPEDVNNACVIYLQKGDTLNWKNFETSTIARFKALLNKQGLSSGEDADVLARNAFNQLDLMFVESFSASSKLGGVWGDGPRNRDTVSLPLTYWRFYDAYIRHKGTATHENYSANRSNVDKRRYRVEGQDYIMGEKCYFSDSLSISCNDVDGEDPIPTATVTVKPGYKGGSWNLNEVKNEIKVTAVYVPLNADENTRGIEQKLTNPTEVPPNQLKYSFTAPKRHEIEYHEIEVEIDGKKEKIDVPYTLMGYVSWTLTRAGKVMDTRRCSINLSGDGVSPTVEPKECTDMNQSEECCRQLGGAGYQWRNGKCEPKEPSQSAHTVFAPYIKWAPKDPAGRSPVTGAPDASTFTTAIVSEYNPTPGHDGCQELFGYPMDSTKATAFVNQVKEAYNRVHTDVPIVFDKDYPQDGEFIDALNVAANLGIATVPAAAVCELGRDFVRMSYDPHAGDRNTVGATGLKGAERIFHNDLGAYLVYVHEDSILYPQSHLEIEGTHVCDWRFQPKGYNQASCPDNGPEMAPRYMYNNYNGVDGVGNLPLTRFKESLAPTQAKAVYPLKALANGKTLPHNCGNCKAGTDYVKKYNSADGFAGLLRDHVTPAGSGKACEDFAGDRTMSVADALKYVEAVCSAGLDYKPYGAGASAYRAGQSPTRTGGGPGNDIGTH